MRRLVVANGPNLNTLGIHGGQTLADIQAQMDVRAEELGLKVSFFQSNHEGALIDRLQAEAPASVGLIINPAGLAHYSIALYDCLRTLSVPIVEVHLTNVFATNVFGREEAFRANSVTAPAARGVISGLGGRGYVLAMEYLNGLDE
jgi:3-dehydroquinate dehydratase-2